MSQSFWSRRARDIAIDLGTANTLVHLHRRGIVLNEPSVVALDRANGRVLCVGENAKRMLGRAPACIEVIRPLKDGVIADFDVSEAMLRHFLRRVHRRRNLRRPRTVIGLPSGVTEVERRAVREAALRAGASQAHLMDEPMAAAIGAGLAVWEPAGALVVDIGGGTSEVAVIALNGIVARRSLRIAGDEIDEAIVTFIHHEHGLAIGLPTAERLKIEIGSACPFEGDDRLAACAAGRDLATGLPKTVEVSALEIREAIAQPLGAIVGAVKETLEETPAELAADIADRGLTLTGGGALLRGIERLFAEHTGMEVAVADNPLACVALGAGRALETPERFAEAFAPL